MNNTKNSIGVNGNDYTMGGRLPSCDSEHSLKVMCGIVGIPTEGKTIEELKQALEAYLPTQEFPHAPHVEEEVIEKPSDDATDELASDDSKDDADKGTADTHININKFVVDEKLGHEIVLRLLIGAKDANGKFHPPVAFVATKAKDPETNGKLIVTMKKLYAIVGDVYGLSKGDPSSELVIKGVIQTFCRLKLLSFKRYDNGCIVFFPTEKMSLMAVRLIATKRNKQ